ncbi:MAG: FtsX-like permease family protein [Nostocoides sp.]
MVHDPRGPISPATQDRVNASLQPDGWMEVERGFHSSNALTYAIMIGAFALLLLVVTLTSTALSLAEQRVDQATLAAVGATRGTRRRLAAGQAFVTSVVGAVLGLVVGSVPGIALARVATRVTNEVCEGSTCSMTHGPSVVVIPWIPLAIAVAGVPLVAAALSAVAIRRSPQVTRRAT